jgi:hypothetical protein
MVQKHPATTTANTAIITSVPPLVLVAMNLVYALAVYPFGKLAVRMSHRMLAGRSSPCAYLLGCQEPCTTLVDTASIRTVF